MAPAGTTGEPMDSLPPWGLWIIATAVGLSPGLAFLMVGAISRLSHRALWARSKGAYQLGCATKRPLQSRWGEVARGQLGVDLLRVDDGMPRVGQWLLILRAQYDPDDAKWMERLGPRVRPLAGSTTCTGSEVLPTRVDRPPLAARRILYATRFCSKPMISREHH